ncbi:MAG TPA: YdcF family protein, partial [Enterococcus sp.]|nr:YdcF family protein [Enterococcus sp.]
MEKNEQRNLKDWNQLLAFLAAPDEKDFEKLSAPTLILAGNGLPILADKAAQMYVNGQVERLFLVGGVGHATRILYENFEKQGFHFEEGMSESEICRQYLKEVYDLP